MKPAHFIFFALFFFVFWSCEQPLDIILEEGERKIIVQSNFTEDNVLQVVVQLSEDISSNVNGVFITSAIVQVFHNGVFQETLVLTTEEERGDLPPYYYSVVFKPKIGETYKIKVDVAGFDPVFATSTIPIPTELGSVVFNSEIEENGNGIETVNFEININFEDPAEVENFYHLIFIQELTEFRIDQEGLVVPEYNFLVRDENFYIQPENQDIPMLKYVDNRSFLINDDLFNGQSVSLTFKGNFNYNTYSQLLRPFKVELRTVTEDYYLYHTSVTRMSRSLNDPLSGPVVLSGNVENGSGIFAGYSSSVNEFEITK